MRTLATAAAAAMLFAGTMSAQAGKLSGRRAPSFALPDINLNYHDILDYRGKVLLLEILKTDCPVCGSLQGIVQRVQQAFGDRLAVLSIVVPPDTQQTVANFMKAHNVKTPMLFDSGQTTAIYMKATPQNPSIALPHVFLIDHTGIIRNDFPYGHGTEDVFETLDPLMKEVGALVKQADQARGASAPAGKQK